MTPPRVTNQEQQQIQRIESTNKKKKRRRLKKKEKLDQQNPKDLRNGAGTGVTVNPNLESLMRNLAIDFKTSIEHLQLRMQSVMSLSDDCRNKNQTNINRQQLGSNCNSRRDSLEQQRDCGAQHFIAENNQSLTKSARRRQKNKAKQNIYVAIDCEMVGVGYLGQDNMLARVSVVNKKGDVLLDKYVKPRATVVDYRTSVSGIRPKDIEHGEEFDKVQDQVIDLLQGKILVGHAIKNDLAVLHIKHPYKNIRDTSRYKPLCRRYSNGRPPSLKTLSKAILGIEIQTGEHNSVEDARAAMRIYNRISCDWENHIRRQRRYSK